ncbi:hypothetical protein AB0H88_24675 [Nonomuraea sp. NPDC050680]
MIDVHAPSAERLETIVDSVS